MTFIDTQRLVYDPVGRKGIHRDCKTPQKPDWKILRMGRAPPSSWKGKAYDYKEFLKNSHSNEEDSEEVEIIGDFEDKRVTRATRRSLAVGLPSYSEDDSESSPVPKRQKKDSKDKGKINGKQIAAASKVNKVVVPPVSIISRQVSVQVIFQAILQDI